MAEWVKHAADESVTLKKGGHEIARFDRINFVNGYFVG
jgi:hypothetical protein